MTYPDILGKGRRASLVCDDGLIDVAQGKV